MRNVYVIKVGKVTHVRVRHCTLVQAMANVPKSRSVYVEIVSNQRVISMGHLANVVHQIGMVRTVIYTAMLRPIMTRMWQRTVRTSGVTGMAHVVLPRMGLGSL